MLPLRILGFLYLICAAGAESTCPWDLDLAVTPAEVLAAFGDSLPLNCSSAEEDHEGIYWKIGDEEFYKEEAQNSISHNLTLSDYNMAAQCRIKINETYECSKDINITVFKNPEVVSSVKHVDAAGEETQYDLQCDVNAAPVQNLVVKWYKNNETVLMKLFNSTTRAPVNESVALAVSIGRSEGAVELRCEAQLDFGKLATPLPVVSQTHKISALYAPEMNATNDTDYIDTSVGENVTLNCDAEGNPPPVFSWTCDGVDMMQSQNYLTFAAVSDTTCICLATNRLGNRTRQYHIYVTEEFSIAHSPFITTPGPPTPRACPLTLTPPEVVARFGDPVLADCNTSATNIVGMGWESPVQGTSLEPHPHVAWSVKKLEDWTITPFCYITLKDGYQCQKSLQVTLYKTPDRMSISGPDNSLEGDQFELRCLINGVAPANKLRVSWFRNEEEQQPTNFSDASRTPVNLSSTLTITAKREYDGSIFRCKAVLHLGPNGPESITTTSGDYTAVVQYKPLFKNCSGRHNILEHQFSLDKLPCKFDGNPPPNVQWYHEDKIVNSSKPLARNDTGMYMMQITNKHGSNNTYLDVTVEYAPSINCGERYEVEMRTHIPTPCEVQGLPSPTLTWLKDGKKMLQWTKHDSGEYKLEATNKHGTSNHTLYLDILYAPEIKEPNQTMDVDQGQNVTLACQAEGNPPPEVFWFFNSSVTPGENAGWRQSTVTVNAATSTTSGVYSCIATNRVGRVTRTVSLVIKGKSRGLPNELIWVIVFLSLLVFLVLVVFIIKRQKKHGQYSFIPVQAASEMRMSTRSSVGSS